MLKQIKYKDFYISIILIVVSFSINFSVASNGVYPVDTFIHYDNGYRILLGELPVKDYWIVHGFLIDFIQAIFFHLFGNNWYAYVIHSSLFNCIIVVSSYFIFRNLKIKKIHCFIISLSISFLAYPISGTPFLDLHATYFSLISIYLLIFLINEEKPRYWFFVAFLLCAAFFSKQVPSIYTIMGISFFNFYLFLKYKKKEFFLYYIFGAISFLLFLLIFLIYQEININDFIFQIFLFPQSIGTNRYSTHELNFNNTFLDFKFIYLVLIPIVIINIYNLQKIKNYKDSKSFKFFIVLIIFASTTIFHQIYTKNQIYIFFLIPFLTGFFLYFVEISKIKNKKKLIGIFLIICLAATTKYHIKFNIERKFHELSNTNIRDAVDASTLDKKFAGLFWISPHFDNPQKEIENLKNYLKLLKDDKKRKMIISEYNFFSSLMNEKLYAPSRTYDNISYPQKNSKYFLKYKNFLVKKIKNNSIKEIYIFRSSVLNDEDLNELIYNYISKSCFNRKNIDKYSTKLTILKCQELFNEKK